METQDSPKAEETSTPKTPTSPQDEPKLKCFPPKVSDTTDAVRLKCRELLAGALKVRGPCLIAFIVLERLIYCG